MALQDELISKSKQIKTDSYTMSIGELVNLYRDMELDVHPEFQRVYRWSPTQRTRLIESILLGIPMPPIFVAQRVDGVWDVVDGVQRLSTVFQFMAELKDEKGNQFPPLVLESTKFLPSLGGKTWSGEDGDDPFTREQQLYFKRAKIGMNIVLKESDVTSKYELFMRLNTGGTVLEPQEVRNCLMLMAYPGTYEWIRSLSEDDDFIKTISLSENAIDEQYHMELASRFLVFRNLPEESLSEVGDIGEFLNEQLGSLHDLATSRRKRVREEQAFRQTFKLLNEQLEDDAFRRYDAYRGRFLGAFSISAYEAIALGLGFNVGREGPTFNDLKGKVQSIWQHETFIEKSGSGVRASARIPKIVPLGRDIFSK